MFHFQLHKIACFAKVNKSFPSFKWLVPEKRKVLQKNSRVSVTPTFHLFLCIGATTLQLGCLPLIINLLSIFAR